MNRGIKFRAWTGVMEYDVIVGKFGTFYVNVSSSNNGLSIEDSATITPFNTILPKDTPVMPYTGLNDDKGKDIFFEDIVRFEFDGDSFYRGTALIVETMTGGAGILFDWDEYSDAYAVEHGGVLEDFWNDPNIWKAEVIGNRFENPDLIKKPKK